jgi:hypothetical protein
MVWYAIQMKKQQEEARNQLINKCCIINLDKSSYGNIAKYNPIIY